MAIPAIKPKGVANQALEQTPDDGLWAIADGTTILDGVTSNRRELIDARHADGVQNLNRWPGHTGLWTTDSPALRRGGLGEEPTGCVVRGGPPSRPPSTSQTAFHSRLHPGTR